MATTSKRLSKTANKSLPGKVIYRMPEKPKEPVIPVTKTKEPTK